MGTILGMLRLGRIKVNTQQKKQFDLNPDEHRPIMVNKLYILEEVS
jgi:hypothetical protein